MSLLALACAPAAAIATPAQPAPKPTVTMALCKVSGDVIFEMDHLSLAAGLPTSHTKLYASGAWRLSATDADGATSEAAGCVTPRMLATVVDDLRDATWKVEEVKGARCHARSAAYTEYRSGKKLLWTDTTCAGSTLDTDSRHRLNEMITVLTDATVPQR